MNMERTETEKAEAKIADAGTAITEQGKAEPAEAEQGEAEQAAMGKEATGKKKDPWQIFVSLPVIRLFYRIPVIARIFTRETVLYILVGVLTTLVDYAVFALVNELLKRGGTEVTASSSIATAIAWVAAVVFAYFTNKVYVFENHDWQGKTLFREILQFFGARILSGLITLLMMRLLVGAHMNEYLAKILTSVFNLVFNYVASKLLIFRKKQDSYEK